MHVNEVTGKIVSGAIRVHSRIGPGLLESAYEACLKSELVNAGLRVDSQLPIPLVYDQVKLDIGYRMDLLVENEVVVEIKSVEGILPVHEAQLLSHIRLSRRRVGCLLNFNVAKMKQGSKASRNSNPARSCSPHSPNSPAISP